MLKQFHTTLSSGAIVTNFPREICVKCVKDHMGIEVVSTEK